MTETIAFAGTDAEIAACFPVIAELRPHLRGDDFVARVRALEAGGFRLAFLKHGEDIVCVAGLRIGDWLHGGRYIEIEDFVTAGAARSGGYGGRLFDWIAAYGRAEGCAHLRLVSGVARERAHAFYERKGMQRFAYYFTMDL